MKKIIIFAILLLTFGAIYEYSNVHSYMFLKGISQIVSMLLFLGLFISIFEEF